MYKLLFPIQNVDVRLSFSSSLSIWY